MPGLRHDLNYYLSSGMRANVRTDSSAPEPSTPSLRALVASSLCLYCAVFSSLRQIRLPHDKSPQPGAYQERWHPVHTSRPCAATAASQDAHFHHLIVDADNGHDLAVDVWTFGALEYVVRGHERRGGRPQGARCRASQMLSMELVAFQLRELRETGDSKRHESIGLGTLRSNLLRPKE
ncbi:hypothetical protein LIA77_11811 [Sarocladium implicatum]|nr:hypothetical protein LIA77_11811 [Sarocladium implicatum]